MKKKDNVKADNIKLPQVTKFLKINKISKNMIKSKQVSRGEKYWPDKRTT